MGRLAMIFAGKRSVQMVAVITIAQCGSKMTVVSGMAKFALKISLYYQNSVYKMLQTILMISVPCMRIQSKLCSKASAQKVMRCAPKVVRKLLVFYKEISQIREKFQTLNKSLLKLRVQ